MICLLLVLLQNASATTVSVVKNNNAGAEALKADKVEEAIPLLVKALVEEPENSRIHLNLGVAFEINKDSSNALKSYKLARKYAKDRVEKFSSHFNIARVFAASKNYNQALESYQKALEANPSSYETKANIELLIQAESKGGGEGKDDKNEDDKDKKDKDFKPNPKPTPIPFKSKKLSKRDVKRIFEELLQQEQKIRKDVDRKNSKEKSREKDW